MKKDGPNLLEESHSHTFDLSSKLKSTPSMHELLDENKDLVFNQFSIRIKDQGEGISKEGIKKLFMDFSRLDENQESNSRGTGLGLSICKQLINKMGGEVSVKSKIGVGTIFKISLTTLSNV